jgi:hypothetical protein
MSTRKTLQSGRRRELTKLLWRADGTPGSSPLSRGAGRILNFILKLTVDTFREDISKMSYENRVLNF